jgi:hypothetical protein
MPAPDTPVSVFGHDYKIGRMSAMRQFHVTRRLTAVLAGVGESFGEIQRQGGSSAFAQAAASMRSGAEPEQRTEVVRVVRPILEAIARMPDADAEFVVNACLEVVERDVGGGKGWARVMPQPGVLMFADVEMPAMLAITFHVLRANLADFFFDLLSELSPQGETGSVSTSSEARMTGS